MRSIFAFWWLAGICGAQNFAGSGQDVIAAMTADAEGNLYVAGSTTSPDLAMHRAAFPGHAESAVMRTVDSGATWSRLAGPIDVEITSLAADPGSAWTLFAGSYTALYKTTDGGGSWHAVFNDGASAIAVDPRNSRRVAAATWHGGMIASSDGGETWSAAFNSGFAPPVSVLATDPRGSGLLLAANGVNLLLSRDSGASWTQVDSPALWPTAIAIDPVHDGWVYLSTTTGTAGRFFVSTDAGKTWTEKLPPAGNFSAIEGLAIDARTSTIYAGMVAGDLYQSIDGGERWTKVRSSALLEPVLAAPGPSCGTGGVLGLGFDGTVTGFGAAFTSTRLGPLTTIAVGADCAVYAARRVTNDVFVAKIAKDRKRVLWSTYLGGTGNDVARAIARDAAGNVYVAGETNSADFAQPGTVRGVLAAVQPFVAKISADGRTIAVRSPAIAVAGVSALAVSASGEAYVTGSTGRDSVVLKLDAAGNLAYNASVGSEGDFPVTAVAVDTAGEALVAGYTSSKALPVTSDALQATLKGAQNGFLLRLSPDGAGIHYATYLGGTEPSATSYGVSYGIFAVAAEAGGVWLAGATAAADFPVSAGAYVAPVRSAPYPTGSRFGPVPPGDVYVMKLTPGLRVVYSALLAGGAASHVGGLAIDGLGRATLGLSTVDRFPLVAPLVAAPPCKAIALSGVVAQLNAAGSDVSYASYVDTCGGAPPIAIGAGGAIFAALTTSQQHAEVAIAGLPARYRIQ